MAKINMHKVRTVPLQQRVKRLILASINDWGPALHEFEPTVHQQVCPPLGNDFDIIKREPFRILNLLRDDEGVDTAQRFYLPVNVQHLQLQKAGAITGYHMSAHTTAASFVMDCVLVHLKLPPKRRLCRSSLSLLTFLLRHRFPLPSRLR